MVYKYFDINRGKYDMPAKKEKRKGNRRKSGWFDPSWNRDNFERRNTKNRRRGWSDRFGN